MICNVAGGSQNVQNQDEVGAQAETESSSSSVGSDEDWEHH